jgi:hypothetical protein
MLGRTGLLAATVLGIAGFAVWSAPGATGPALIRVTGTQSKYARIDAGKPGSNQGDTEFIRARLFNRRITPTSIGRSELVCTFTFGSARSCQGTFFLNKGKIVVGGGIPNRDIYELAILGGTGLYDNARGTLTVTRTSRSPRREFLLFRLTG